MSQFTIEDIARLASVSRSTVSRVLNDHPSVRPGVRDRVWSVIKEYGYAPQAAARHVHSLLVSSFLAVLNIYWPTLSLPPLVRGLVRCVLSVDTLLCSPWGCAI